MSARDDGTDETGAGPRIPSGRSPRAEDRPLRLRALDEADLRTVAACLQDALVPLSEIAYLTAERRFVMVANRFRWESAPEAPLAPGSQPAKDARFADHEGSARYQRVHCGVCIDRVRAVRFKGLDARRKGQILNLLTMEGQPGAITLIFAGGASIRLETSGIRCHLEDLGEPWPTQWRPSHPVDENGPADQR